MLWTCQFINVIFEILNFDLQLHQNAFGGLALPGPTGGAYSAPPDPLAGFLGIGVGKEGEGKGEWEGKEEEKGVWMKGKEGKGKERGGTEPLQ